MVSKALGLIETVGLAAAFEAADAACKAANVLLMGYELTKGGGMVLIRVSGDVGAVKTAVEAGRLAAEKVNKVVSTHVIPRPHQQLPGVLIPDDSAKVQNQENQQNGLQTEGMIKPEHPQVSEAVKGTETAEEPETAQELEAAVGTAATEGSETAEVSEMLEATEIPQPEQELQETEQELPQETVIDLGLPEPLDHEKDRPDQVLSMVRKDKNPAEICNICHDPACHRKKGDPKVNCIHYAKNFEEAD